MDLFFVTTFMKLRILIVCLIIFLNTSLFGQFRKYSNEFLNIGVGSKALAMGNAVVANSYDATAVFWNPAGISHLTGDMQIGLMHNQYFAGIASFNYGGIVKPLNDNGQYIGISMVRLDVDMIPNTLRLINPDGSINYDNIEDFSISDNAVFFTYAQKSGIEGLSFGGNFKVIRRMVSTFANSWGFGFDLAAYYERDHLKIGATLRDATSTVNVWSFGFTQEEREILESTGNIVPTGSSKELTAPSGVGGVRYEFVIKEHFTISPEVDLKIGMDGKRNVWKNLGPFSADPMFGLQLGYRDIVHIWGGLNNYQDYRDENNEKVSRVQPNLGVGLKIKSIKLQYAMTNMGDPNQALYSNVFSLVIDINKKSL